MTDKTNQDTLTTTEAITATQLLKNLKNREDSLLDLTNNFSSGLVEFSDNVETLRNLPHKISNIIKNEFKTCSLVLTEKIQDQINASVTSACKPLNEFSVTIDQKITNLSSQLENQFQQHLGKLITEANKTSESAKKATENTKDKIVDNLQRLHNQANRNFNHTIESTDDTLRDIEKSAQAVLDKFKADNNNQWKWMLTVFVSSVFAALLVTWLRTYW